MKTKLIVGSILLLAVVIINSCENKVAYPPIIAVSLPANCDTAKLTYSSDSNSMMQGIINLQCGTSNTSCHSPGSISTYDLSTYSGIYAQYQNGNLYAALFGNSARMPQIPQSGWDPACMYPKFKAWMNRGCPQ